MTAISFLNSLFDNANTDQDVPQTFYSDFVAEEKRRMLERSIRGSTVQTVSEQGVKILAVSTGGKTKILRANGKLI